MDKRSNISIAKNGGEITTDNFKDIGAIVGSENEKEKLKISAKTIEVKDLEDSINMKM